MTSLSRKWKPSRLPKRPQLEAVVDGVVAGVALPLRNRSLRRTSPTLARKWLPA